MPNYYFKDNIESFLDRSTEEIIGAITMSNQFDSTTTQNKSWEAQVPILKKSLIGYTGTIYFEFSIPRMGKRIDALVIIKNVVFVLEFKVGEKKFLQYQIDQVWDYALDLKNFHKPSHGLVIAPILISTESDCSFISIETTSHDDKLIRPIRIGKDDLKKAIETTLLFFTGTTEIDAYQYERGSYSPTPTIIEAAVSLYNKHTVKEITRNDAEVKNLTKTTSAISEIINLAKSGNKKIICFITGVPGAGKTLVGLEVATSHLDKEKGDSSVYLSGNAPLVAVLQEALTRDKVKRERELGNKITKVEARIGVKLFIQIIHHYRDSYLVDPKPPFDHVAIFDEAQRAWNKNQTVKFMKQKKGITDFDASEPEYLISCLDRHADWAVIICLVGGGQEINTGEAGISEWLNAVYNKYAEWQVYISPNLIDSEYRANVAITELQEKCVVHFNADLHLAVSMRSYRAENVSHFVKCLLDLDMKAAKETLSEISTEYPIVLTRDLLKAKNWLREKARGSERYGLIVSSQAQRLKPLAIDVRTPINPVNWFLESKEDVRSSYYLEDVATEFQVQGLELDWTCVTWDGDLRYSQNDWKSFSFVGDKWQNIDKEERKKYQINAYRVLLTRARQGMVIVVPDGSAEDHTRKRKYYDPTFEYLREIGIEVI